MLPEIRQDLELYPAEFDADGAPQWHIHDPLANQYYRLNDDDVQLLPLFGKKTAAELCKKANSIFKHKTTEEEVEELVEFLRMNNLVKGDPAQLESYQQQLDSGNKKDWFTTYVKGPMFFRYPLCNPDKFLDSTLSSVLWMGTKPAFYSLMVIGLLGLYLFSRQMDSYFATFQYFFNWSGIAIYIFALAFIKILHELGHAYVAKAYGCRVPTIGVALIMGWPILFTDTSDAWKIVEKKKRMAIGAAGVGVELAIAILSLFLWSITPSGSIQSALFLLSSTTWIMSILVNFNPLMRFDGYYLLSDYIRFPNLEKRAFALARWWLREKLFAIGFPAPEEFRLGFVIYAYSVWVYRFFLFLGIAYVVYNFFFKAVGLVLFILAMIYFLAVPIFKEVVAWWEMRDKMTLNHATIRSMVILLAVFCLVLLPWQSNVPASALLQGQYSELYLPESGQITAMPDVSQNKVLKEDVLFELNSPTLERDIEQATFRYTELRWTQSSLGFDPVLRNQARVVNSELLTQNKILRGLLRKNEQLVMRAPVSGEIVDVAPDLKIGDWLPKGLRIATVVDTSTQEIVAYVAEEQLDRIILGATAKFFPENIEFGIQEAFVKSVDLVAINELDNLYLSSMFGGDVAVRESESGEFVLVDSHYKIQLELFDKDFSADRVVRGIVIIDGKSMSFFSRVKRKFIALFLRETGF